MNEVANSTVTVVGNIGEIPVGEGRAFDVNGEQVAVFRLRDGSLRALGAACPHKGGPPADGLVDASVVICPLHGYTYDLTTRRGDRLRWRRGRRLSRGYRRIRQHQHLGRRRSLTSPLIPARRMVDRGQRNTPDEGAVI